MGNGDGGTIGSMSKTERQTQRDVLGLNAPALVADRMLSTLDKKVLSLAEATNGMSTSDVSGHTVDQVGKAIALQVKRGMLFMAKTGHRSCRYFTDAGRANAYESNHKKMGLHRGTGSGARKAPWPADTRAIETATTKYTYGKSPSERVLRTNTHSSS